MATPRDTLKQLFANIGEYGVPAHMVKQLREAHPGMRKQRAYYIVSCFLQEDAQRGTFEKGYNSGRWIIIRRR